MNNYINFIEQKASWSFVGLGLFLIMLFNALLLPEIPPFLWGYRIPIEFILDIKMNYSSELVSSIFSEMESLGRHAYLMSTIFIDSPYFVVYSIVYSMLLLMLLKSTDNLKFKLIVLIPFFAGIADFIENVIIIKLILSYSEQYPNLVFLSSIFTKIKWGLAGVIILISIVLLLKMLFNKKKK